MKETNFEKYQDFVEAIELSHSKNELEVFVIDLNSIPESAVKQMSFFRNEFFEISLAEDQNYIEFAIDGKFYRPQGEPCICFIAPDQLQSYRVTEDTRSKGYMIYFSKQAYQNLGKLNISVPFFKREYESYHQLTHEEYNDLSNWVKLMLAEYENPSRYSNKILTSLLCVLVLRSQTILKETKSAFSSRPEEVIDHFQSLLEKNSDHQSVQFYADEMALTTKQLNTLTKRVLNKTALKIIQESTIEKAKGLILQSNLTFTEIAYKLGFDELSNFSRLFKRITNYSPNQFREERRN